MKNPRFFFRVNGRVPDGHLMLGYHIPFRFDKISELINQFTKDIEWDTVQIKIMPSLIADKTRLLIISTEIKHFEAPHDHLVMLLDDKSHALIASSDTLESLFEVVDENFNLKNKQ